VGARDSEKHSYGTIAPLCSINSSSCAISSTGKPTSLPSSSDKTLS